MDPAPTLTVSPLKRRACVSCTAVKAKCSPHVTLQTICERCNRLGKDCVFLDLPERRRRPQSARIVYPTSQVSQVNALENKLEALSAEIAALKQQQNDRSGSASQSVAPTPAPGDDTNGAVLPTGPGPAKALPPADLDQGHGDTIDRGWITMDDAEHLVATFKENFIPRFPFVTLASRETAVYLRRHSPFLFLCIVAVPLYTNQPLQQRLGEEVRRQLSLRLLFNSERSMDLLRGLLVYSAWYQYFAQQGHGQLFMLSQLCVTVAYDLGLPEGYLGKGGVSDDNGKRAVLGTFWLSVVASRILQRPVGLRHSKALDDWSLGFAVGPEHVTDTAIQPMILLQAFAFRFIEAFPGSTLKEEGAHSEQSEVPLHATTPFLLELESIKEKIKKDGVGPAVANYIELEVLHLESWLSQVAFVPSQQQPGEASFAAPGVIADGIVLDETQFLWQKIRKNQQSLEHLLQMPLDEMYCMPLLINLWLCGSLTWLGRAMGRLLSEIMGRNDSAAWKISEAQRVINEVRYLTSTDALSRKFEAAYGNLKNEVDDSSELGRLLHHIRMLRRSYHWQVQRITGANLAETNMSEDTPHLTGHVWGGDAELLSTDFDAGGAEDFGAGTWTSINDFLFLDEEFMGKIYDGTHAY